MQPGLLSGPAQDPNGDEALAQQIAREQGVPMNVARYMLQAPSREDSGRTYGGWPYPYQGQSQETPVGPQRDDAINRQMWQQRLTPPGGREALLQQMMRLHGLA
jgi:hypothetical protein